MSSSIQFSYDDLKILGVLENRVYVQGELFPDDDGEVEECALIISRRLFERTLKMWLDCKQSICEHYARAAGCLDLCGVMGSLRAIRYRELPEDQRAYIWPPLDESFDVDDPNNKPSPVFVRTFAVTGFDPNVDMEHG